MSEDQSKRAAASPDAPGYVLSAESLPLSRIIAAVKHEMAVLDHFRAKYAETDKGKAQELERNLRALFWNLQILLGLQYWMGGERLPREISFVVGELLQSPAPSLELMELLKRMPRDALTLI